MHEVTDNDIRHYEGLVRKTAAMYVAIVEDDYDDICSVLRIKVWQALLAFDPAKARQSRDAYVFMCVKNRAKDVVKKVRRNELYIEDVAPAEGAGWTRDAFECRYLMAAEEQVFGDLDTPLIPSTITAVERKVIACLYLSMTFAEISDVVEEPEKEVANLVRGIREKMADWRPSPATTSAPVPQRIAA